MYAMVHTLCFVAIRSELYCDVDFWDNVNKANVYARAWHSYAKTNGHVLPSIASSLGIPATLISISPGDQRSSIVKQQKLMNEEVP